MAFDGLLVTEIFHSLQGETSLSGVPFVFVRLTGCNLRCVYCDSAYSFKGGTRMTVEQVLEAVKRYDTPHVLLTGGEPLLQRGALPLIHRLNREGFRVSIETHGEVPIEAVAPLARIILDIKTPGSGYQRGGYRKNLGFLKPGDEVKFVITSRSDYEWTKKLLSETPIPVREILLSPAMRASGSPGTFEGVSPADLARWILEDRLPVRFQIQLHKYLWGADTKGV
jgi:7-carboxy-7-deazaguanine synthase